MIRRFAHFLEEKVVLSRTAENVLSLLLLIVFPTLIGFIVSVDPAAGMILFAADVYLFVRLISLRVSSVVKKEETNQHE